MLRIFVILEQGVWKYRAPELDYSSTRVFVDIEMPRNRVSSDQPSCSVVISTDIEMLCEVNH